MYTWMGWIFVKTPQNFMFFAIYHSSTKRKKIRKKMMAQFRDVVLQNEETER